MTLAAITDWRGALWKWTAGLAVAVLLMASATSRALSLPFMGPEQDFELRFTSNEQLRDSITDELMEQKKNDPTLKQYSSQHKIDRYLADTIRRMLRAEGYYDSEVAHQRQNQKTIYLIEPGPRYTLSKLSIRFPDGVPAPDPELLKLSKGDPLRAADVLAGRSTVTDWVYLNLCLYQVQVDYEAKVFHKDHTASVTYTLRPSEEAKFGELKIEGPETVDPDYLHARLPIKQGECFSRQRINQTRLALLQTNLIASAEADIGPPVDGTADVTFKVTERRHRTFRVGVGYDMNRGPGMLFGWEHRNLFGRAENLDISTRFDDIGRSLEGEYTIPHFRRPHQSLVLHANTMREKPDAYESTSGSIGAALARQATPELFGSLGVRLRYAQILEDEIENDFSLISTPFTLEYDKRDNFLNATAGWKLGLGLEPFLDISETERHFVKSRFTASAFHSLPHWRRQPTFAVRAAMGTITGVQRSDVPADLRFYVGGGGSVRGYPYQTLGELTDEQVPEGGRSFTEITFETRVRLSDSWGAVVFVDGGYAYPEEMPAFGKNLLWGTGVGIRYLTDFAPIRFDVAVPLDRRDEVDDRFQVYISIGQAF